MKTSIDFLNALRITKSVNFEKKVIKNLPTSVNKINIIACGMKRASGHGSYNYFLDVEINDISMNLSVHTNSSPAFDDYQDLEVGTRKFENWIKNTVLMILDDKRDYIIELISEDEEYQKYV